MVLKLFNDLDLEELINNSRSSPRRRAVRVIHPPEKKGTRLILNCIQPDSYVQPHFHPGDSSEIWIPLQGRIGLVTFSVNGLIEDYRELSSQNYKYAEIGPGTYHSGFSLEKDSIMYEFSEGPYNALNYKIFAPWAPSEENKEMAREYLFNLKKLLHLSI